MQNINRRQLYAAGETLGESVTMRKPGGSYVCGGGGGGSSSSSSSTTTNNYDKRQAVGDGGLGITGDSNALKIQTTNTTNITDGGIVKRALDSVDVWNATNADNFTNLLDSSEANYSQLVTANADGFSKLIGVADKLFNQGENLIGQTQKSVADAYAQAQTEAKGTIDNKTIIVLAVAGAAVLAFRGRK